MAEPRFLRPAALIPVGDTLWVFDEFQPVAAVLDRATAAVQRLVCWPEVGWAPEQNLFGDDTGVWLQPSPRGSLVRLTEAGVEFRTKVGDLWPPPAAGLRWPDVSQRIAAGPTGAWAWCRWHVNDTSALHDAPPAGGPLVDSTMRLVGADGATRSLTVQGRVNQAEYVDGALQLRVDVEPWYRDNILMGGPVGMGAWALRHTEATLRVPFDGDGDGSATIPARITVAEFVSPSGDARRAAEPARDGGKLWNPWYPSENELHSRRAQPAGGLSWVWGCLSSSPSGCGYWGHQILATGHDQAGELKRRVELGAGRIVAGIGDGRYLWLAVRRRQSPPMSLPVELLRVDGRTGEVEIALTPTTVDITGRGWPLRQRPGNAARFAEHWRTVYSALEHWWHHPDGSTSALSDGISNATAELIGDWPDTVLRLEFDHERWPGIRMIHQIELFDELGRQAVERIRNADWRLAESLDGGLAPLPQEAVDGELWL
ncbi:MAG: hypothetical protein ACR2P2_16510 [Nakamurella sp.]